MQYRILTHRTMGGYFLCFATMLFAILTGCEPPRIETGYGKSSGSGYSSSLNGTSVLHQIFESLGHPVDRYSKMSPRWDSYQTVFWIPDSFYPPTPEHIQWAEWWLQKGDSRTLVYVARDYNAATSYWDLLCEQEDDSTQQLELRKKLHNEITNNFRDRIDDLNLSCLWFRYKQQADVKAKVLSGVLAENIDSKALDLRYGDLPYPGSVVEKGKFGIYDTEVLLTVDNQPMVYKLYHRRFGRGQIIIVGNASFLLNLPLANPANQELASELVKTSVENANTPEHRVLFIENFGQLPILEHDVVETHSAWSWITKQPLRYIVPNILFCSMLFCFVYFPIFGRARKIKPLQSSNFRDHVEALGQLIKRTGCDTEAHSWIEIYKRRKNTGKSSQE